jgi:hypothetical protein
LVRNRPDAADAEIREHRILARMLADADVLCGTGDALLSGQYRYLRGRIAALVELTSPIESEEGAA